MKGVLTWWLLAKVAALHLCLCESYRVTSGTAHTKGSRPGRALAQCKWRVPGDSDISTSGLPLQGGPASSSISRADSGSEA